MLNVVFTSCIWWRPAWLRRQHAKLRPSCEVLGRSPITNDSKYLISTFQTANLLYNMLFTTCLYSDCFVRTTKQTWMCYYEISPATSVSLVLDIKTQSICPKSDYYILLLHILFHKATLISCSLCTKKCPKTKKMSGWLKLSKSLNEIHFFNLFLS